MRPARARRAMGSPSIARRAMGTWPSCARRTSARSNSCPGRPPAATGALGLDAQHRKLVTHDHRPLLGYGRDYYLPVRPRKAGAGARPGRPCQDADGRDYLDSARASRCAAWAIAIPTSSPRWSPGRHVAYQQRVLQRAAAAPGAGAGGSGLALRRARVPVQLGAEANEAAIKLVRKWAAARGRAPAQRTIVTFRGSFTAARWPRSPPPRNRSTRKATSRCRAVPRCRLQRCRASSRRRWPRATSCRGDAGASAGRGLAGCVMPAAPVSRCRRRCARCAIATTRCWCWTRSSAAWDRGDRHPVRALAGCGGAGVYIVTPPRRSAAGPIGAMLAGPRVAQAMQFGAPWHHLRREPAGGVRRARGAAQARIGGDRRQRRPAGGGVARRDRWRSTATWGLFAVEVRGRGLMLGAVLLCPCPAGRAADLSTSPRRMACCCCRPGPTCLLTALRAGPQHHRRLPDGWREGLRRLRDARWRRYAAV